MNEPVRKLLEEKGGALEAVGPRSTVLEAITRQTSHYAAHVGQIVLLAKHHAGARWQSLSIPRGKSKEFDVSKSGAPYEVKQTR